MKLDFKKATNCRDPKGNFLIILLIISTILSCNAQSAYLYENDEKPLPKILKSEFFALNLNTKPSQYPDMCKDSTFEELDDWDASMDEDNCVINWDQEVKNGNFTPEDIVSGVNDSEKDNDLTEDSLIIFTPKTSLGYVVFSHEIHTYWLGCEGCHYGRRIFIPLSGANKISMKKIISGEYCGVCHGPHSKTDVFKVLGSKDCDKCHSLKTSIT